MITTVQDFKRGCGWRKPGGLYLMAGSAARACGLLPIILRTCPACGGGVKPARGWTWIDPDVFVAQQLSRPQGTKDYATCVQREDCGRCWEAWGNEAGLLWIGEKFYARPADWVLETEKQGASRRINSLPKGFVIGTHWVMVAHRKVRPRSCPGCKGSGTVNHAPPECPHCKGKGHLWDRGIFQAFKPDRVEYVVKGDETEDQLQRMRKRGITPVRVERMPGDPDQMRLLEQDPGPAQTGAPVPYDGTGMEGGDD